jgi:hypothetical protein
VSQCSTGIGKKGGRSGTKRAAIKLDKLAYSINDLQELGFGCRAYIYGEINAGRLRATKRGRFTVVLAGDLDAWVASLPTIKPRSAMAAE